ncbi:MAG TPA: hypothetical protein VF244_08740 [Acidimicrobiales bacterium]
MLVVGSVVLVGCGGDDDDESTTPATAGNSSTDGGGSSDLPTGGSGISSAACLSAATAMAQAAGGLSTAFSGGSEDLEDSVEAFEAFAANAPSEIRDDLRTVAEGYAEFVEILADANFNPASGEAPSPETMARLEAASEQFDDSEFEAAAERVTAWFENECGEG